MLFVSVIDKIEMVDRVVPEYDLSISVSDRLSITEGATRIFVFYSVGFHTLQDLENILIINRGDLLTRQRPPPNVYIGCCSDIKREYSISTNAIEYSFYCLEVR